MSFSSSNPKVSVVTVCLNSERFLERTIRSVLSQTYKNIEYVIVDGVSKDSTLEIISKYRGGNVKFISEPDRGIYDAQNKGLHMSSGEIVCFLNSDDYFYTHDVVGEVVGFYLQNKGLDFVYGDILCSNPDNSEVYLKKYPDRIPKRYFLMNPLAHSATFFHKNAFAKAGYFDIRYKISADFEWYLRALYKKGLSAARINKIISVFQEGGFSSNARLCLSETNMVLNLYFNPIERTMLEFVNFFLYLNFLRVVIKFIFRKKGYELLRSNFRKIIFSKYLKARYGDNGGKG